jgi:hypothetical protein
VLAKYKKETENALALAEKFQRRLTPKKLPLFESLTLQAALLQSNYVGGDFFDARKFEDRLVFTMGDTTGHGLAACQSATALKLIWDKHLNLVSKGIALGDILNYINQDVQRYFDSFPCLLVAVLDQKTGILSYAKAGYPHPILIRNKKLIPLDEAHGPLLGLDANIQYQTAHIQLLPGDRLMCFSDGLTELFGIFSDLENDILFQAIAANLTNNVVKNTHMLFQFLSALQAPPWSDDVTLFNIAYHPPVEKNIVITQGEPVQEFLLDLKKTLSEHNYSHSNILSVVHLFNQIHKNLIKKSLTLKYYLGADAFKLTIPHHAGFQPPQTEPHWQVVADGNRWIVSIKPKPTSTIFEIQKD